jgi:hypothetical protein
MLQRLFLLLISTFFLSCENRPSGSEAENDAPPADTSGAHISIPTTDTINNPKLLPVDEGAGQADFYTFRNGLLDAINRKDREALLAHVDSNVQISFGVQGGLQAFRETWFMEGIESPLWELLRVILENGGTFRQSAAGTDFAAPYVYAAWPGQYDAFQHMAILEREVPVYENPGGRGIPIAYFNHDIVRVDMDQSYPPHSEEPPAYRQMWGFKEWYHISTIDGTLSGYVHWKKAWSPVGYRALFRKVIPGNQWKLTVLIAGD